VVICAYKAPALCLNSTFKLVQFSIKLICKSAWQEPLEILQMTLGSLRDQNGHIHPSEIEVVLAMEFKDDTRDETFQALNKEFMCETNPVFARFTQTVHKLDDVGVEVAGKSSNENHAVRELYKMKTDEGVNPERVMVTICDADSLFAPEYLAQLDLTYTHYPNPGNLIYDSPINTYRNYFDAEVMISQWESMRCYYQFQTIWRCHITMSSYPMR